jgi:hypothetical protein
MVSRLFNILFRQQVTDFYTGIKALRRDALNHLNLKKNGFEHVVEIGAQLARAGFCIQEIPVEYRLRSRGTSKMRHIPEMLKFAWYVAWYRFGFGFRRKSMHGENGEKE